VIELFQVDAEVMQKKDSLGYLAQFGGVWSVTDDTQCSSTAGTHQTTVTVSIICTSPTGEGQNKGHSWKSLTSSRQAVPSSHVP
jgi:hypothetical protein